MPPPTVKQIMASVALASPSLLPNDQEAPPFFFLSLEKGLVTFISDFIPTEAFG